MTKQSKMRRNLLRSDYRLHIENIEFTTETPYGFVQDLLQDDLGMRRVRVKFVTRIFTEHQMENKKHRRSTYTYIVSPKSELSRNEINFFFNFVKNNIFKYIFQYKVRTIDSTILT